jgi:hypothetical protein
MNREYVVSVSPRRHHPVIHWQSNDGDVFRTGLPAGASRERVEALA